MRIGEPLKMAEYIERENAIAWFVPYAHAGESIDADVVISDIKGMKVADVAPVRHGRWRYFHKQNIAVCTECSFERDLDTNFGRAVNCPNCGAKMDGGKNDGHQN